MKKLFQEPKIAVTEFAVEDVISTSSEIIPGGNETPGGGGL